MSPIDRFAEPTNLTGNACRGRVKLDKRLSLAVSVSAGIGLLAVALFPSAQVSLAEGTVNVLYAGSLVNLMEHGIGPAFEKATRDKFQGYGGGSNGLANQIKGKLRRGDVFISANPKVNNDLMGASNGDWVNWYVAFAQSPWLSATIRRAGLQPSSRPNPGIRS
jgi:ABC-type molybdate transport system substrate-binding protein